MPDPAAVLFQVRIPVTAGREGDWVVACCSLLDLASQGRTEAEAFDNLREAAELFFESCYRRGTLTDVLHEAGLEPRNYPAESNKADRARWLKVPLSLVAANAGPDNCHA